MDHHKYIYMAQHPVGSFHIAPFCWRVGAPLLAGFVSPGSPEIGFRIINFLALVCAALVISTISIKQGADQLSAACITGMFLSVGWLTKYSLYNSFSVDAPAVAIIALCIMFACDQKLLLFVVAMCVGVVFKETVLLGAFPAILFFQHMNSRLKAAAFTSLPILILVVLHVLIPARNDDASYLASLPDTLRLVHSGMSSVDLSVLFQHFGLPRITSPSFQDINALTFDSIGLAALICIGAFGKYLHRAEKYALISGFVLATAQFMIAANIQRTMAVFIPIMLTVVARGSSRVAEQPLLTRAALYSGFLTCMTLLFVPRMSLQIGLQICVVAAVLISLFAATKFKHR